MFFTDRAALGQHYHDLWLSIRTLRLVGKDMFTSLEALYGFRSGMVSSRSEKKVAVQLKNG